MFSRLSLLAAGLAILLLGVVIGAACGAGDDNADAQEDTVNLTDLQRVSILTTMNTIRVEGLHEIDEASQQAEEIEAGWSGSITRIRQAVAGTLWPDDLAADGDDLEAKLIAAEDAIAEEDLAATKTAITDSHGAWHELEHAAYTFAAGEEHSDDEAHDESESESDDEMDDMNNGESEGDDHAE